MRFIFRLTSSRESLAPKTQLRPGLETAYGHNKSVNHNTVISRGANDFNEFRPLDSHEDINYYNDNVPLKIYRRQEVHITCEVSDGTSVHTRPSRDHVSPNTASI